MTWIARWIVNAFAITLVGMLVPGIHVTSFPAALFAVVLLGTLNIVMKPILFLLTLPVTIVTFGLFSFVLNAMVLLVAGSVIEGFRVDGFGAAFIGSIVLSGISMILQSFIR